VDQRVGRSTAAVGGVAGSLVYQMRAGA
jgi:hypothetical protein